jgi:hypothetical protein
MRFLLVIHADPDVQGEASPSPEINDAVGAYFADHTHGRVVTDGGLGPVADAYKLHSSGGNVSISDGPFAESKEVISGFFVIESPSPEDMSTWAKGFIDIHAQYWADFPFYAEVRQIVTPEHD